MNKTKHGFTLVELMIVMILLGILMLAGWVGYGNMRQSALKSSYCNNIRTIETAIQAWFNDNSVFSLTTDKMQEAIAAVTATDSTYISDTVKKNVFTGAPIKAFSVSGGPTQQPPTNTFDPTIPAGDFSVVIWHGSTDPAGIATQFTMITNPSCTATTTSP